jgi:hypothetical protein
MAKTKFEDMTPDEKKAAFETWVEGRTARRAQSKIKRAALDALKKAHQAEYDQLMVKFGGKAAKK